MLNLFLQYQGSLTNGAVLSGANEILRTTSSIINIFKDRRPIMSEEYYRLNDLHSALTWFSDWE